MSFRRQPKRPRVQLTLFDDLVLARPANRQGRYKAFDPFARGFVLSELRGESLIELGELEGVAEEAHERAVLLNPFESSVYLAAGHGYAADPAQGVGCGLGGLHPNLLLIRPSSDLQKWNMRVLHELAHALLRKLYPGRYTHADVWALTLMLACPRRAFRSIALATHVPRWSMDVRRMLARAAARAA